MLDVAEWEEAEAPFEETAWSVVLAAGAETDARAQAALAELCRIYWRPIYAYLRRSGRNREDAQDLTQSFFQHVLENETLRRVSREKGRFRSFLLGALKLCLADEQARRHTLKRGGGVQFISTDELEAEELHHLRQITKLRRMRFSMHVGRACSLERALEECAWSLMPKKNRKRSNSCHLSWLVRSRLPLTTTLPKILAYHWAQ